MSADNTPHEWTAEQIDAAKHAHCSDCNAPPYRPCQRIMWDGDYEPYVIERSSPHSSRIKKALKQSTEGTKYAKANRSMV